MAKVFRYLMLLSVSCSVFINSCFALYKPTILHDDGPSLLNTGSSLAVRDVGIGFDLTTTHGVVAASFANGTNIPLASFEGDQRYRDTMHFFSQLSSQHVHPPYNNMGEEFSDKPRQLLRQARKNLGLPSSDEVGVLAGMVAELRSRAENVLGQRITVASMAFPHMPALYHEDVADVFDFVKIEEQPRMDRFINDDFKVLWHNGALWAGHGLGLCQHWQNRTLCYEEDSRFPELISISFGYEANAMIAAKSLSRHAFGGWEPLYRTAMDWSLGHDDRFKPRYWEDVEIFIVDVLNFLRGKGDEDKLVFTVYGTYALDPTFIKLVHSSLEYLGYYPNTTVLSSKPEMAAAFGAAEMAKRGGIALLPQQPPGRPNATRSYRAPKTPAPKFVTQQAVMRYQDTSKKA